MFVRCQQTAKKQAAGSSSASATARCLWSVPMLGTYAHCLCICLGLCPLYSAPSAPSHASALCFCLWLVPMLPASTCCLCSLNLSLPLHPTLLYLPLPLLPASASVTSPCLCSLRLHLCPLPCLASAFNFSFFCQLCYVFRLYFDCGRISISGISPLMDIAHTQCATVHLCRPSYSLSFIFA